MMLKLTLHDDREIAINTDKIMHITVTQDDETGATYSRVFLGKEQNVDVTESLDHIIEKVSG